MYLPNIVYYTIKLPNSTSIDIFVSNRSTIKFPKTLEPFHTLFLSIQDES